MKIGYKKILIFLLLVAVVFSMVGCGTADPQTVDENATSYDGGNQMLIFKGDKQFRYNKTTQSLTDITTSGIRTETVQVNPNSGDYGLNAGSSITGLFRGIAIMMINTTLSQKEMKSVATGGTTVSEWTGKYTQAYQYSTYKNSGCIKWKTQVDSSGKVVEVKDSGGNKVSEFAQMNLNPIEVIKDVNVETSKALQDGSDTYKILNNIIDLLQGCAAAVLISIWAMGFISQIVNEKFSMETLIKTLMQLLCGIVLIKEGPTLVRAFVTTGNLLVDSIDANSGVALSGFVNELTAKMNENITVKSTYANLFNSMRFGITYWTDMGPVWVVAYLALPFVALMMCAYKIISRMIMRMIELIVRIIMAPIPLAFSAQHGFGQESIRYLRATFACAVEPVLMMMGAACSTTICNIVWEF